MSIQSKTITRRVFIQNITAATAAFSIVPAHVLGLNGTISPSDKLDIAFVGINGRGGHNLRNLTRENVVALCDVDSNRSKRTFAKFPKAKAFNDFRKMLDKMDRQIDAVVVSTPDHTHTVTAMKAIKMHKHVYCEKPLAHSLYEVRQLTDQARKAGVATQLGNQGHSAEHIRMLCEWVWDGAIGPVREVHAWHMGTYGDGKAPPSENPPVPDGLDWDLWIGPAAYRPYNPVYMPGKWRSWVDFGTGLLGDFGCHVLDPACWALNLGYPSSVSATNIGPKVSSHRYPLSSIVRYDFPARGNMPSLKLTWYNGKDAKPPRPEGLEPGRKLPNCGAILIGDKGTILHGSHGASAARIIPETKMQAYQRPPKSLARSTGHHKEWVEACKGAKPAGSNFNYGGNLTEIVLVGAAAIHNPDTTLNWDGKNLKFTNHEKANLLVHPTYRKGWHL